MVCMNYANVRLNVYSEIFPIAGVDDSHQNKYEPSINIYYFYKVLHLALK